MYILMWLSLLAAGETIFAQCPNNTPTVVFGNGILNTEDDAQFALDLLQSLAYDSTFVDSSYQPL